MTDEPRDDVRPPLPWLPFALAVGFGVLGTLWLLAVPAWARIDVDEGGNLAKARLLSIGHDLYGDIWSDQPPMFTWLVAGWEALLGIDVTADATAARVLVVLLASMIVFVAADVARHCARTDARRVAVACVVAVMLLVGSKLFVQLSGSVMIGLPAISFAVLSLWCLWRAGVTRTWLALLAGVLLGFGLLTKLNVFTVAPAVVWLCWTGRDRFALTGLFLAGLFGTIIAAIVVEPDLGRQLVTPHVATLTGDTNLVDATVTRAGAESRAEQVVRNVTQLSNDLRRDLPLLLTAVAGAILIRRDLTADARRLVIASAGWLVLSLAILPFASPLWAHHITLVTVPLSLMAATVVGTLAGRWPWCPAAKATAVLAAIAVVGASVRIVGDAGEHGRVRSQQLPADVLPAALDLRPEDGFGYAYADDTMLAIAAGRLPLPEAAVPSMKRRRRGELSDAAIADMIEANRPDILILGRFDYPQEDALTAGYRFVAGDRRRLYVRTDLVPSTASTRPSR
ncbi:MAG: glycosyltransferase family 39 protein [Planctomycetota bacterium]